MQVQFLGLCRYNEAFFKHRYKRLFIDIRDEALCYKRSHSKSGNVKRFVITARKGANSFGVRKHSLEKNSFFRFDSAFSVSVEPNVVRRSVDVFVAAVADTGMSTALVSEKEYSSVLRGRGDGTKQRNSRCFSTASRTACGIPQLWFPRASRASHPLSLTTYNHVAKCPLQTSNCCWLSQFWAVLR